jgi:acetyltransferase-like isoleucine patch superfamily enzyme
VSCLLISKTAIIHENVRLGEGSTVEDFAILGKPVSSLTNSILSIGSRAYIRCGSIIYGGTTIGTDFSTGDYAKIREGNTIGNNVSIGSNTILERDSIIGNGVRIHSNCFVPEHTRIEDSVWIGPCAIMTSVLHPPCPIFKSTDLQTRPRCLRGPILRRGAIVGAGVIILPGVEIGERSLLGAGAVVRNDVPAEVVVAGSSATQVGTIKELVCPLGYYGKGEIYSWRK